MNSPVQWSYDVRDVQNLQIVLEHVLHKDRRGMISGRTITLARDQLHELTQQMERAGLEEECEEAYLCLFDALCYLNCTLKLAQIDAGYVLKALHRIEAFFEAEVIS